MRHLFSLSRNVMETHFISIALIREVDGPRLRWLAQWKAERFQFDFVSARRLEKESYRESITREVAWVLNLSRERDFLVANTAQINCEFIGRLVGEDQEKHIAAAFYPIHLYGDRARQQINADENSRWVTADEIYAERTDDGRLFNPVLIDLIRRTRVIQPWEST